MAEMARDDMQRWLDNVGATLPMGSGTVCIDSTPNDGSAPGSAECDGNGTRFTIKIWWDNNFDGQITVDDTNVERLAITFQL